MQRIWGFGSVAVTAFGVDFVDPAYADQPDVRERGVRLEVRPLVETYVGSVYASDEVRLAPALVRVDLLESAPYAADRMHWHPTMHDGEPGDRAFVPAMVEDPGAWVAGFLADLSAYDVGDDAAAIAEAAPEIVAETTRLLALARQPWPEVAHDERGLTGLRPGPILPANHLQLKP